MIFTLLLWSFMFLIYFSSRNNLANRWCAIAAFVLSIGTFKEYLHSNLAPVLITNFGSIFNMQLTEYMYSIMTAILYYLAMPCCVIFSLYFSGYQNKNPKQLQRIKGCLFLLAFILTFLFYPHRFSYYQQNSRIFWYVVSVYNITYGIIMAVIMLKTSFGMKSLIIQRQKKLVSIIILPPIWYWLITIFVIHSLGITSLYKAWQDNAYILSVSIILYIITAFTEGIMGLKLQFHNYHWDSDMKVAGKGAHYTSHILKNELTKIEWCLGNLSDHFKEEEPEELAIIGRSVNHLKQFVHKTQLYSNNIVIKKQMVPVADIINNALNSSKKLTGTEITIETNYMDEDYLDCDPEHMTEVLNNLISNAAEAMHNKGIINISSKKSSDMQVISITDDGDGIPKKYLNQLFNPYFTTKKTGSHFGLGLSYCYNVLKKHKGYIDIHSEEGKGSTFSLYLPL